jgi:integrase
VESLENGGSTSLKLLRVFRDQKKSLAPKRKPKDEAFQSFTRTIHRRMSVISLIGHFCIQRKLFCQHIISSPIKSPCKRVTRANLVTGFLSKAIHVHTEAHICIGYERAKPNGTNFHGREHRDPFLINVLTFLYATWCRSSELQGLRWKDVYLEEGYVHFRHLKEKKTKHVAITSELHTIFGTRRLAGDSV